MTLLIFRVDEKHVISLGIPESTTDNNATIIS